MVTKDDFYCDFENKWCPGCGNFAILSAMKEAFTAMDIPPEKLLIVSGIGQAGKTPHFLKCNFFHGLHGRALPVATGAKIANHELTIVVNSGDGDCYGEGGNHFLASVRRNVDLTLLVHNNKVYGLTKGQASPTSDVGFATKLQPDGVVAEPFNPLAVALALGAGFVARGFSGNRPHLARLIRSAMGHQGFALVDILQPCPSFNRIHTHAWYKERVYEIPESPDRSGDREAAFGLAREWGERIPIGILYQQRRSTYTEHLAALKAGPLIRVAFDREQVAGLMAE